MGAAKVSASDEFRDFMKKTPAERMVDQILKSMGITPEELEAMPAEKQLAVMEKVRQIIEEKMRLAAGVADSANDAALSPA